MYENILNNKKNVYGVLSVDNFINIKAKIIDKKYFDSKTIILVYEIKNISNNSYQNLYFNFNIKQHGMIKKIVLEKNKKYIGYTSGCIYVSSINSKENISFGVIISLDDDTEKICPIELIITFNDYLGGNYGKRIIKYLKSEDDNMDSQNEMLFLYASKEYKNIIKYKILLINSEYSEIRNIVVPINIPSKTNYIRDSLIIGGTKRKGNIKSIQVNSLKINECIYLEYSVKIKSIFTDGNLINNINVTFKNNEDIYVNLAKATSTKVKDNRIKIIDTFKGRGNSKYRL